MPTLVEIPEVGLVEFPDGMDDAAIAEASGRLHKRAGLEQERQTIQREGRRADTAMAAADVGYDLVKGATPQGLVQSAGRVVGYVGDVAAGAAEDVIAGERTPTSVGNIPNPIGPRFTAAVMGQRGPASRADTPLEQGVVDAFRMTGTVSAGIGLSAMGVPAPVAFGAPMGAETYARAKAEGLPDEQAIPAAAQATAMGSVIPGVAQAGRHMAARALGAAVERGLLSGSATTAQKATEILASQGTVQAFMEGMNVPAYLEASPQERKDMLVRNLVANGVFLGLDVPNLVRRGPSATQQGLGQRKMAAVTVADVLQEAVRDPVAMDAILTSTDQFAIRQVEAQRPGPVAQTPESASQMLGETWQPLPDPQETMPPRPVVDTPPAREEVVPGPDVPFTGDNAREGAEAARGGTPIDQPMPAPGGAIPQTSDPITPTRANASKKMRDYWAGIEALRQPDVIDWIQANVGRIRSHKTVPKGRAEYDSNEYQSFRQTGWGRKLLSNDPNASPPDVAANMAYEAGQIDQPTAPALWNYLLGNTKSRADFYKSHGGKQGKVIREETSQAIEFSKAQQPAESREMIAADDLFVGDSFELKGEKVRVKDVEFDEDGRVTSIVLEDGRKFGTQRVDAGAVMADKGTLQQKPRETTDFPPADEAENAPQGFFDGPESVADQQAREAREAEAQTQRRQRQQLEDLAAAPLVGATGDIGQGTLFGEVGKEARDLFAPPPAADVAARRGTSGIGRPMALPALPPGTTPGTGPGGLPMAMEPMVRERIRLEPVRTALEDIARAAGTEVPMRRHRFLHKALGIFKPHANVIRLLSMDDLPTASHEVAHALASKFWRKQGTLPSKVIPAPARRELVAMGRALYGSRQPAAGYTEEGWAEFIRLWLTTEDAQKTAPKTSQWMETMLMPKHPEVAKAMQRARAAVDVWRGQGARNRALQQMRTVPGFWGNLRQKLRSAVSKQGLVDAFVPLERMSMAVERATGRKLRADEDPYLIASAKRGTAGMTLQSMVNDAMIDFSGNRTGGRSLRESLAPATGNLGKGESKGQRVQDFWLYMWARRATERWAKGRNPGMAREDAEYLKRTLQRPEFDLAAKGYYEWWDGVLDYVASSSPRMAKLVETIREGSDDYVPLARIVDPSDAKARAVQGSSNPLNRMRGSARPVRDISSQTLISAERLVAAANREKVLESIFELTKYPDVGFMVEEVPRDRAMKQVNFEHLRKSLEDMGVDTTAIPDDTIMTWYQAADRPKGVDPIVVRQTPDGPKWYQVDAKVYDMLDGLQPSRLGPIYELFVGMPSRAFRLGATGLRASFAMVTNPIRDLPTYMVQSTTDPNPVGRFGAYLASMKDIIVAGLGGKKSPFLDAYDRLGISAGTFVGGDIAQAKREAKSLFHGKFIRRIESPIETLREFLSWTESVPRLAEFRRRSQELNWTPGTDLTPEQAMLLTVAAKRVTTDFSARGDYGGDPIIEGYIRGVPFANAAIQGMRAFGRALRDRPVQTTLYGLSMFTLPALANWWRNKDEEWYKALPWRERWLYTNIDIGNGVVVQVPRPPDWGAAFMVLPEGLADLAYTADPQGMTEAMKHIFATTNPAGLPVLANIGAEQLANRIFFFDRPIVPRSQQDLPPGEQVSPYSSRVARYLGETFPNSISPRRVDAAIRGYFSGTVPDVLAAVDLPSRYQTRGTELSDIPIAGRLFRRGGDFSSQNRHLSELYDLHYYWQARARSVANPISPADKAYADMVRQVLEPIREVQKIVETSPDPTYRRHAYSKLAEVARKITDDARKSRRMPWQAAQP